jgi:hypothetical protein
VCDAVQEQPLDLSLKGIPQNNLMVLPLLSAFSVIGVGLQKHIYIHIFTSCVLKIFNVEDLDVLSDSLALANADANSIALFSFDSNDLFELASGYEDGSEERRKQP